MPEGRIEIPREDGNLAGATENVQPPRNENIGGHVIEPNLQELISSAEKERKCLFRIAFGVTLMFVVLLYSCLIYWLFSQAANYHIHSNLWHIALILALPPTTLLFLLIKVLAKQDTHSTHSTPAEELVSQLVALAKSFFDKK